MSNAIHTKSTQKKNCANRARNFDFFFFRWCFFLLYPVRLLLPIFWLVRCYFMSWILFNKKQQKNRMNKRKWKEKITLKSWTEWIFLSFVLWCPLEFKLHIRCPQFLTFPNVFAAIYFYYLLFYDRELDEWVLIAIVGIFTITYSQMSIHFILLFFLSTFAFVFYDILLSAISFLSKKKCRILLFVNWFNCSGTTKEKENDDISL